MSPAKNLIALKTRVANGSITKHASRLTVGSERATLAFPVTESIPGAVAQLGERMTGSHEVRGSIPRSSTKKLKGL